MAQFDRRDWLRMIGLAAANAVAVPPLFAADRGGRLAA